MLDALDRALHMTSGARERWAERRASGLDDDALRAAIAEEFGICTGASGFSGNPGWTAFGNDKPALYLGGWSHIRQGPKLEGAALLDAARRLMQIPRPANTPEQQELL